MSNLINRKHCRDLALSVAAKRAHKFERVSKEFLDRVDSKVHALICYEVLTHPSKGKTLL